MRGPTCIFWANLTPFSLWQMRESVDAAIGLNVGRFYAGMLTQWGQGGRPAPLAARFYRILTRFPLALLAI